VSPDFTAVAARAAAGRRAAHVSRGDRVSPDFTTVGARARGLSAHLFTRPRQGVELLASLEVPA